MEQEPQETRFLLILINHRILIPVKPCYLFKQYSLIANKFYHIPGQEILTPRIIHFLYLVISIPSMRTVISLLLFFCCGHIMAQHKTTGYIGIEQGLSNNSVTCIHHDRNRFMWFGTYDGLNRYDGYAFRTFRNRLQDSTSLVNNRITVIEEDSIGNMWIGTKRGVSRYDNNLGAFSPVYFQPYATKGQQQVLSDIYCIGTSRSGDVFVGTADQGLLISRPGEKLMRQVPAFPGKNFRNYAVSGLAFDRSAHTWLIITDLGLCRYDEQQQRIIVVNPDLRIANCLITDDEDNLWAGTDEGVFRYERATGTWKSFTDVAGCSGSKVISLTLTQDQQLWISTDGEGIFVLPVKGGPVARLQAGPDKQALTSNAVYAVYEDREQRKWIGTLRGGVNIIDKQKVRFRTINRNPNTSNSLSNNFTFSFCEDHNNEIWIGTDGGGISRWNREKDTWQHFVHQPSQLTSLSNNNVTSIVRDGEDQVWMATFGGGINRFDRRTQSFVRYKCFNGWEDRFIWKLYVDTEGRLWAGGCMDGTLYQYNRAADRFEVFDPSLRNVLTLSEDRNGQLWAGTYQKLVKLNKKGSGHQFYDINFSVRAIYEDVSRKFWIGTEGGGLLQFNREEGTFRAITEKDGLPNNSILSIEEDKKGNLWMSTYNGLVRYSTADGRNKNFYASDGLQSNQFYYNAALRLVGGEMMFGGIRGFNIFHPDSIAEYTAFPALQVTGLRVSNEALQPAEELVFPYDKAVFSLDYVALEYSAPDKISYAYYLENWDNDWNYVRHLRTANYSRLKEGRYTLHIKSTNADGIWNPQERIVHITVLPPWYRTWWAYGIYLGLIAGMLYCYRFYQRRQARLQYEVDLSHLRIEKEKELNEKKLNFFTNISHEFRTPLTLIINPVKELLYSDGKNIENKDLTIVYRNARRLLSLVDQFLLFRKADREENTMKIVQLNITDLCREVFLCFTHQAELKKMQFTFQAAEELPLIYGDREKIEVMLFNLLSNAFKYSQQEGAISVSLEEAEGSVVIRVKDSGCGIAPEVGDKLFEYFYQVRGRETLRKGFGIGLFLVKKFVTDLGGTVTYSSRQGVGSEFSVTLLTGTAHLEQYTIFKETQEDNRLLEELAEEEDLEQEVLHAEETAAEDTLEVLLSAQPSMLVVDDNEQMRQYIRNIFRQSFTIYEARDGNEGLALAGKHLPDIIISDVLMDGLSGIELCQKLKQDPALGHIPVVLLTASSSSEIKLKGIEGGADDYMSKPFDKEMFIARIDNIIRGRNTLQRYFYSEITGNTGSQKISAEYKDFLNRCIAITEKHLDNPDFNIRLFAQEVGISHSSLYKKVKSISGRSVSEFIRFIRLRKAAELLINTGCNVNEAAFSSGFNDVKYFREQFTKLFDMTPSKYILKYRRKFDKTPKDQA